MDFSITPDPVTLSGSLLVRGSTTGVCLVLKLDDGAESVVQSGSNLLSWKASLAGDGSVQVAKSGIVSGNNPYSGVMLRQAGQRATLTGMTQPSDPDINCGLTTQFVITAVR